MIETESLTPGWGTCDYHLFAGGDRTCEVVGRMFIYKYVIQTGGGGSVRIRWFNCCSACARLAEPNGAKPL